MHENIPTTSTDNPEMTLGDRVRVALGELEYNISAIQTPEDVEMHAYDIMDGLPEAQTNADEIAKIRKNGGDDKEAVERQAALFDGIKQEIALISGVELEEDRVKRENIDYRQRAQALFGSIKDVDDRNILLNTGFLKQSEQGEATFQFPEGIFPPHIIEKWDHYLDIVKRHVTVISRRQLGLDNDIAGIAQLDAIRTSAHNNLALAVQEYMQIPDWDLEKCRNFVIKMRDAAIPNIETAEENVTANAVRRLVAELEDLRQ